MNAGKLIIKDKSNSLFSIEMPTVQYTTPDCLKNIIKTNAVRFYLKEPYGELEHEIKDKEGNTVSIQSIEINVYEER